MIRSSLYVLFFYIILSLLFQPIALSMESGSRYSWNGLHQGIAGIVYYNTSLYYRLLNTRQTVLGNLVDHDSLLLIFHPSWMIRRYAGYDQIPVIVQAFMSTKNDIVKYYILVYDVLKSKYYLLPYNNTFYTYFPITLTNKYFIVLINNSIIYYSLDNESIVLDKSIAGKTCISIYVKPIDDSKVETYCLYSNHTDSIININVDKYVVRLDIPRVEFISKHRYVLENRDIYYTIFYNERYILLWGTEYLGAYNIQENRQETINDTLEMGYPIINHILSNYSVRQIILVNAYNRFYNFREMYLYRLEEVNKELKRSFESINTYGTDTGEILFYVKDTPYIKIEQGRGKVYRESYMSFIDKVFDVKRKFNIDLVPLSIGVYNLFITGNLCIFPEYSGSDTRKVELSIVNLLNQEKRILLSNKDYIVYTVVFDIDKVKIGYMSIEGKSLDIGVITVNLALYAPPLNEISITPLLIILILIISLIVKQKGVNNAYS